MNIPKVTIEQDGAEIGYGKMGSVMPLDESTFEVTLHDVHMNDTIMFEVGGPFTVRAGEQRYRDCMPTNFKNIRPGYDYDRVVFSTDTKPKI